VIPYGGVVDGKHKSEEETLRGVYLHGAAFESRYSLPDVAQRTKIVAVCGINDGPANTSTQGNAGPQNDGWFFSDFYLFHHLFKEVANDQVWLTCVQPEHAVARYGQYVHGNPNALGGDERRIVLDKTMLGELSNVRTVAPKDLLERFLSSLRQACKDAAKEDPPRPVLVIVLGHGKREDYSIIIGGEDSDSNHAPHLTVENFKIAIGTKKPNRVCLLTSSCFGGGWSITPELNITTATAAPDWEESLSWPSSGTMNQRHCGSIYASGIAKTLLKMSVDGLKSGESLYEHEAESGVTFAGFVKVVTDQLVDIDNRRRASDADSNVQYPFVLPMFSAKDDEWEMEYRERIDLSLNQFKTQWLKLKAAAGSTPPPGGEYRFGPGERLFSFELVRRWVTKEAKVYFNSFPGPDNSSRNIPTHSSARRLLRGEVFEPSQLLGLHRVLDHRLNSIMGAATMLKKYLKLPIPDCEKVDVRAATGCYTKPHLEIIKLVMSYQLFDCPGQVCGHYYDKVELYLSLGILYAKWDRAMTIEKLDELVDYKCECFRLHPNLSANVS
jgi:hypothetical protein